MPIGSASVGNQLFIIVMLRIRESFPDIDPNDIFSVCDTEEVGPAEPENENKEFCKSFFLLVKLN